MPDEVVQVGRRGGGRAGKGLCFGKKKLLQIIEKEKEHPKKKKKIRTKTLSYTDANKMFPQLYILHHCMGIQSCGSDSRENMELREHSHTSMEVLMEKAKKRTR